MLKLSKLERGEEVEVAYSNVNLKEIVEEVLAELRNLVTMLPSNSEDNESYEECNDDLNRLVPGFEAPVTVGYATSNRSAVIRIPAYAKSPDKRRFELRNPDATCNPYFCYAAILMAGLDGVKNKIDPHANGWGPYDVNLYHLSDEEKAKLSHLPVSLEEALDALENDHDYLTAGGVFPEELLTNFIKAKREECRELAKIPHPAEFDKYYNL